MSTGRGASDPFVAVRRRDFPFADAKGKNV
jgi:hypothetical protein